MVAREHIEITPPVRIHPCGLPGKGVFEVGLVFGSTARNLVQADWRSYAP